MLRRHVGEDRGLKSTHVTTVCAVWLWLLASAGASEARDGISTTADNRILVELALDDTVPANPFDLNGRTLVFTPDGEGGYSRDVRELTWENDIGGAVADGAVIELERFTFPFAGRRWDAFHVNRHGLLTFNGPLTYMYWDAENRFDTMRDIAGKLIDVPTISPLYKPMLGGRSDRYGATQHVARWPHRVVITWITTEPDYYVTIVRISALQIILPSWDPGPPPAARPLEQHPVCVVSGGAAGRIEADQPHWRVAVEERQLAAERLERRPVRGGFVDVAPGPQDEAAVAVDVQEDAARVGGRRVVVLRPPGVREQSVHVIRDGLRLRLGSGRRAPVDLRAPDVTGAARRPNLKSKLRFRSTPGHRSGQWLVLWFLRHRSPASARFLPSGFAWSMMWTSW